MNMKQVVPTLLVSLGMLLSASVYGQEDTSPRTRERVQVQDETRAMTPQERSAYFDTLRERTRTMTQEERRVMGYGEEPQSGPAYGGQPQYQNQNRNRYEYGYGQGYESRMAPSGGGGMSSPGGSRGRSPGRR